VCREYPHGALGGRVIRRHPRALVSGLQGSEKRSCRGIAALSRDLDRPREAEHRVQVCCGLDRSAGRLINEAGRRRKLAPKDGEGVRHGRIGDALGASQHVVQCRDGLRPILGQRLGE
jgi:hypothetical protein